MALRVTPAACWRPQRPRGTCPELDLVSCITWFGGALQLWAGGEVGGGPEDSLKGHEGVVFSHCHCDGLGTLVMEEVGCQAGRRGTGASEQKLTMASPVLAPQGVQTTLLQPKDCIGPLG